MLHALSSFRRPAFSAFCLVLVFGIRAGAQTPSDVTPFSSDLQTDGIGTTPAAVDSSATPDQQTTSSTGKRGGFLGAAASGAASKLPTVGEYNAALTPSISACQASVKALQNDQSCEVDAPNSSSRQALQVAQSLLSGMASNPTTACGEFGTLSATASIAISGYESTCKSAIDNCMTACNINNYMMANNITPPTDDAGAKVFNQAVGNVSKSLDSGLATCEKYSKNLPNLAMQAMTMMNSFTQAQQACAQLKLETASEQCLLNPNAAGCSGGMDAGNCNNPANTSAICQCYRNPGVCSSLGLGGNGTTNGNNAGISYGGAAGATAGGSASSASLPMMNYSGTPPAIGQAAQDPGAGGTGTGGSGAGGFPGPGGGTPPAAAGKQRAAAAAAAKPVVATSGGYLGSGSGASTAAGSGYGDPANQKKAVFGGALATGNPPLGKFAPGPYDPQRGLAGVSGPDGITGPNTDLWEKVSMQYSQQQQKGAFLGP